MTTGPTWMDPAKWHDRVEKYRAQGRSEAEIGDIAAHLQARGPRQPRSLTPGSRMGYIPADLEPAHLVRNADGTPAPRLRMNGDRLDLWSPSIGAFINPKSRALAGFGLVTTYARGDRFHAAAFKAADLRPGRPVELRREHDNVHDKSAVALHSPGSDSKFGYVQRGKVPGVARRLDAGEQLVGVSLRGPGPRRGDDTAFILIASAADLAVLTD